MLRIAQYRSWEELKELQPHWNNLLSNSGSDTVFLTWEWCEVWWKTYGAGRELFVLAAWEDKDLIAIAPLYIDPSRRYGRSWRVIRLIGDGSHDSDYLDCFAQHGREAETMAAFAEALCEARDSWDWMELNGPRKDSSCAASLVACARERHWEFSSELIPCATLNLPKSWDDYLRMLEPRVRTKVRSSLNLLTSTIKCAPVQCSSEHNVEEWLLLLFDLHTRRWASENQPGVFQDSLKQAFYRSLSRIAFERGWLAFHRVNWGERTLALQYGLLYGNRFHLLQEGYDPDFATIRPGLALRAWLIRHWIDAGLEQYDFLAGVARHKLDWGATETFSTRTLIASNRPAKTVSLTWPKVNAHLREAVALATPRAILSLRKNLLTKATKTPLRVTQDGQPTQRSLSISQRVRRTAALAYSSSPLGAAGRKAATRYAWSPAVKHWSIPIERRDRPVVHIFQYHRVNDDVDLFLEGLSIDAFRAQMQYLANTFPIVTLNQIAEGDFPSPYCAAVTFDDGYRDNFVCAFPILKELGIPATIFLATGYIESEQLPWYDQVRLAFKLTTRSRFTIEIAGSPGGCLTILSSRLRLMEQTLSWLRGLQESERGSALAEVYRALGVAPDLNLPNQLLRWEDIRQMSKQKISFGAHTVTHPVLSKIPASQLKWEVENSKKTIESRLQMPVLHFAYPFGQAQDFSLQAKHAVRDAGFKTTVTTIWGLNEADDDRFELKRFTPWETNLAEFKLKLDWFRFRHPQKRHARSVGPTTTPTIAQEAGV